MADLERLCINTVTVREQWSLVECIEGCMRHEIGAIVPWRQDLERTGHAAAARRLQDSGLMIPMLASAGRFTGKDAGTRKSAIDNGKRAIDEALAIGAASLQIVPGGLPEGSRDLEGARAQVRDGLAKLLEHARQAELPLALEPFHPMYAGDKACICTLSGALDLCDDLGCGIGVVVDVYHVWWDADLVVQIARAGEHRLLSYQVCDWLVPTRDMALDRGMMGDGVIDISRITACIDRSGYAGPIDVEIFSSGDWWKRDPDEVFKTIKERFVSYV